VSRLEHTRGAFFIGAGSGVRLAVGAEDNAPEVEQAGHTTLRAQHTLDFASLNAN